MALTARDIEDGEKIADLFITLSPTRKEMAQVYLSALGDVERLEAAMREEQHELVQ